jgi:hypothetical protein
MNQPPKTVSAHRTVKLLLVALLVAYMGLCTLIACIQRSLLYYPQVFSAAQVDQMAQSAGLERWTNPSGANIGLKRPSPRQPATGSVLIMYGNGSTATQSAHYADAIQSGASFDAYILEYPGYEDRPGKPSEKSISAAACEALQMIPTNQPVYLVGESLGTGVASYLAGTFPNRIAGILLISPFNKITSVAQYHYPILPVSLLMVDRYPSEDYLRNYHGNLGITVDGQDTTVPEKFGRRLYDGYNGPKKLWEFPDGQHCEITGSVPDFLKEAVEFLQTHQ